MQIYTTREVAKQYDTDEWRVRRLFEDETLPEPPKFGGKRAIPAELLPRVKRALIARGWIGEEVGV